MAKRVLMAIYILSCITIITFIPLTMYLITHIEESAVDVVYLDIMAIVWGIGVVLAIFWRW